jgi:hypothetical protein
VDSVASRFRFLLKNFDEPLRLGKLSAQLVIVIHHRKRAVSLQFGGNSLLTRDFRMMLCQRRSITQALLEMIRFKNATCCPSGEGTAQPEISPNGRLRPSGQTYSSRFPTFPFRDTNQPFPAGAETRLLKSVRPSNLISRSPHGLDSPREFVRPACCGSG